MANGDDYITKSPIIEVLGGNSGNPYLSRRPENIDGTKTALETPTSNYQPLPQVNEGPVALEQVRGFIKKITAATVPGGTLTFGTEVTASDGRLTPEELKSFRNQTIIIAVAASSKK